MRDPMRLLGTLYLAWAVVQIAVSAALGLTGRGVELPYPVLYWVSLVLLSFAYVWTGLRLRAHDPRVRLLAIVLAAFALISFPVGTLLGVFGLYVLLRKQPEPHAP